jgi:hypothetical protein
MIKTSDENELIEIAKGLWFRFRFLTDKSCITKKVIDNLLVENSQRYHSVFAGTNPEHFSKEKALELLVYDPEVYGLLTKQLQADEDILSLTTKRINNLPVAIFNNKIGINYILDKYNIEGQSWAVYDEKKQILIIKRNVDCRKYFVYHQGNKIIDENFVFSKEFYDSDIDTLKLETFLVTDHLPFYCLTNTNVKHLD